MRAIVIGDSSRLVDIASRGDRVNGCGVVRDGLERCPSSAAGTVVNGRLCDLEGTGTRALRIGENEAGIPPKPAFILRRLSQSRLCQSAAKVVDIDTYLRSARLAEQAA